MSTSIALEPTPAVPAAVPAVAVTTSAPVDPQADAVSADLPPDVASLQWAVEQLNRHFSSLRTDLKFSVEKDLNRIVIAVIDSQDGSVLRQIPSEEALRIARMLESGRSNLIEAQA